MLCEREIFVETLPYLINSEFVSLIHVLFKETYAEPVEVAEDKLDTLEEDQSPSQVFQDLAQAAFAEL